MSPSDRQETQIPSPKKDRPKRKPRKTDDDTEKSAPDLVQLAYEGQGPTQTMDSKAEDDYDDVVQQSFPASDPPPFP